MTAKWKEVSAYTGEAVEEDAQTNNAGSGVTGDIGITTTGFEAAETVSIVLILKKVSGYGSRTDYSG